MKVENTGIDGAKVKLKELDFLMKKNGLIRAGQWDYERVMYDYKMNSPEKNITYYLRIPGYAVEGDIDSGNAVVSLMTPLVGKHFYPHGTEYGEKENFPSSVLEKSEQILIKLGEVLEDFQTPSTKEA